LIFFPRDTVAPQNHPEAEQLIHSASAILDSSLPPSHPFIANTLRGLRRLYGSEAMNDPDKLAEIRARLDALDGRCSVSRCSHLIRAARAVDSQAA